MGLIRKVFYSLFLLVFGGGLITLGLFLPSIFSSVGINAFYLRIIGFGIVTATVILFIAMFETLEHM